jgi:hypothetical protein
MYLGIFPGEHGFSPKTPGYMALRKSVSSLTTLFFMPGHEKDQFCFSVFDFESRSVSARTLMFIPL